MKRNFTIFVRELKEFGGKWGTDDRDFWYCRNKLLKMKNYQMENISGDGKFWMKCFEIWIFGIWHVSGKLRNQRFLSQVRLLYLESDFYINSMPFKAY